jgi:RNA polymerase sigma-70 factor (sigma-E family)
MDIDEYRREREALHIAYRRHYAPLVRFCALLAADRATAEDIVQDVFVRGAPRITQLPETAQLPYLRRAVTNDWKNRQRRKALDLRVARFRVATSAVGDEPADASDRHVDLWAAILRLPPKQRACLVLRYYEDLTEAETASVLGVRIGTVKSQAIRALSKLREVVER